LGKKEATREKNKDLHRQQKKGKYGGGEANWIPTKKKKKKRYPKNFGKRSAHLQPGGGKLRSSLGKRKRKILNSPDIIFKAKKKKRKGTSWLTPCRKRRKKKKKRNLRRFSTE